MVRTRFPPAVLALLALGCGGAGIGPVESGLFLAVTTATTGEDRDDDGYSVQVDGQGFGRAIGNDDREVFGYSRHVLGEGDHEVGLIDVADNCSVQGENPRTLRFSEGATVETRFDVVCEAVDGAG